jgi:hypothetical protein
MSLVNIFREFLTKKRSLVGSKKQIDLKKMTVVKLKAVARERGLSGYSKLNKAGLVKLLS